MTFSSDHKMSDKHFLNLVHDMNSPKQSEAIISYVPCAKFFFLVLKDLQSH